jgi:tRNA/rRNA methyltransferase
VQAATVEPQLADARQVSGMLAHWEQSLADIGFLDPAAPKKLMPRLNQLFNRARLAQEEVHILRGIAKAMTLMASKSAGGRPAELQGKAADETRPDAPR